MSSDSQQTDSHIEGLRLLLEANTSDSDWDSSEKSICSSQSDLPQPTPLQIIYPDSVSSSVSKQKPISRKGKSAQSNVVIIDSDDSSKEVNSSSKHTNPSKNKPAKQEKKKEKTGESSTRNRYNLRAKRTK